MVCISGGTGNRNMIFGYPESVEKLGLRQVEQGFSSFFAKCLAYLMIFQSGVRQKIINYNNS